MPKPNRSIPVCQHCGASGAGVEFPIFPVTPGESFGTICVPCDSPVHPLTRYAQMEAQS